MSKILIFNPSNDMALSVDSLVYLPPRNIQRMESDLALLPLWWAEEGDFILCPSYTSPSSSSLWQVGKDRFLTIVPMDNDGTYSSLFKIYCDAISDAPSFSSSTRYMIHGKSSLFVSPWGWSRSLLHFLIRMGFPPEVMPTETQINDYRSFSSRSFSADYIHQLFDVADLEEWSSELVGRGMQVVDSVFAIDRIENKIFKTLWSSSGRGVFVCSEDYPQDIQRIESAIRQQGAILTDDFYEDKLLDFALEFEIPAIVDSSDFTSDFSMHILDSAIQTSNHSELISGTPSATTVPEALASEPHDISVKAKTPHAVFLGYSVFKAGSSGNYGYNIVESQDLLRERILSAGVSESLLDRIIDYSASKLSSMLYGRYSGPVGIDMLICRHDGKVKLHPCIEINLRRNMGILAIDLYNRLGTDAHKCLAGNTSSGFSAQVIDGKFQIMYH